MLSDSLVRHHLARVLQSLIDGLRIGEKPWGVLVSEAEEDLRASGVTVDEYGNIDVATTSGRRP